MEELVGKAAILHEALPYIRRFHGRTFVVKYGGAAMVDDVLKQSFARDVALLRYVGIQVVVVHGGGPQISQTLERMGIKSSFSEGLRITDDETMNVVEMVLGGGVNLDIVSLICSQGGRAVGIAGKDDHFLQAERVESVSSKDETGNSVLVDLGRVGRIKQVKPALVQNLIKDGFIPVIAPIGVDENGAALNVNADTAAGHLAAALSAAKLVLMTDVEGVKDRQGSLVRSLDPEQAQKLLDDEVIRGGMIPKIQCALDAVRGGVEKVHIVDGRCRHALLLEIFTDRGVGTEIAATARQP